ncbi:type II secretion system F family protein [Senegalia massiliensis]|uniref:Flp pilus assembly protein TadB n=1 Tax=Senegalia massiliensis TaxID=1720316 RepID=A0A845QXA9_9CLOT|nr:hypothetical protein [Senegalia massiliensis]NBI07587.1 hypothetical protein [Senegalia massiliensis]
MLYVIPLSIPIILFIIELMGHRKRKLRVARKKKFTINFRRISFITDKLFKKNEYIYNLRSKYAMKISVISDMKRDQVNIIAEGFITISFLATLILVIFLFTIMNMWLSILIIGMVFIFFIHYSFNLYLNLRLKKIHRQFPIAVQKFTDIYLTNKNIKATLNECYIDMPNEISYVFERLARRLSSEYEYKKYFREFADSLKYVWAYAFAELLVMSYEGSGDISDELLFLNDLINDDIHDMEESKSELTSTKLTFLILTLSTLGVFLFNIFINDIAKFLYLYTTAGNGIITMWVISVAIGIFTSTLIEKI